jgi:hypothetical protein
VDYQTAISHPHWTSGLSSPEFHVSLPDYEHKIGTKKNCDRKVRDEILFKCEMVEINKLEVLYHSDM